MTFRIFGQEFEWEVTADDGRLSCNKLGPISEAAKHLAVLMNESEFTFIDSETTGLKWMNGDKVFSFALTFDDGPVWYFNFQKYGSDQLDMFIDFEPDWVITDKSEVKKLLSKSTKWVGHNLKFDHHMLRTFGYPLQGELHDTMVIERVLDNDNFKYSLKDCVARNIPEHAKDDAVEEYIDNNGLYHVEEIEGKNAKFKAKYFNLVPFYLIAPYACNDIEITRALHKNQLGRLKAMREETSRPSDEIIALESKVLRICCEIEARGVLIDREYCEQGIDFEDLRSKEVERWFKDEYGQVYTDSAKRLVPIFERLGFDASKTAAGADSVDSTFLASVDHPLARNVEIHRDAVKRANTYFRSFISLSDKNSVLHPDMLQAGTRTGRFSYRDPNLQNVPAEDDSPFPIRRAIRPRPGHFFLMIDYAQQEFRMMLDYAGQLDLIEAIKNGHDPHQATADLCSIGRKEAKTINFGLMYGMGIGKLAARLGITYEEAKSLKWKYFGALPKVKELIYKVSDVAKVRGAVYTWMNRRLRFPDPNFAYKAINAIIQGGCADVTKLAMVKIDQIIKACGLQSRILLQIHDELLFEMPFDEVNRVEEFKAAMESVYPYKHIPLTTSLAYSLESFHDSIEAATSKDIESAIRAHVQKQSEEFSRITPQHVVHENAAENYSGNA